MAPSCIILEIKQNAGQKSWFFHTPFYSTPLLGGSLSDYCLPVSFGKTRMMGLPDGEKNLMICLPILYERDRQTDTHTQTDRQTNTAWWQRPRLMQASRGNLRRHGTSYKCSSGRNLLLLYLCTGKQQHSESADSAKAKIGSGIRTRISRLISWCLLDCSKMYWFS